MKLYELFVKEDIEEILHKVGSAQRGAPERHMVQLQFIIGGGVLNQVIEHVGDLTHRMTLGERSYAGYEFVKDKVDKCLKWTTAGYGFEREVEENIASRARFKNLDEDELRQQIYAGLDKYAELHSQIPVYNKAQKLARNAAVNLGLRHYSGTKLNLWSLQDHLSSPEEWLAFAHEGL